MANTLRLVGGWSGILAPIIYVATWAVLGASRDGYSASAQAISELGEIGAGSAPAMSVGFVLFGLLSLPFAAALARRLPGDAVPVAVAAVVCGLATMAAAAFPCSRGCPGLGATVTDTGHAVVAITGYLALMATPLLAGRLLLRAGASWRPFALWSLVAGATGSVLMLLWVLGVFGTAGGTAQRTFNTVADAWWLTAGVVILRGGPHASGQDDVAQEVAQEDVGHDDG